ncbi:PAS domain-containing protein [uncultured Sphingomonas sp.]|uniref:PAS domain-containing protein n=1 Tax=uncultured Sphingomonas sp. TaxID=158754 RepID=UPI0025E550D5|nr:PAS domain-containing protein [uncultured Sphingomonas sp.]
MAEARAERFIESLLRFDGALARQIAEHDWAGTAVGPIGSWSESLKTALGITLLSPAPMALFWGTEGITLYNDAYAALAGGRHPALLGARIGDGWPAIARFNDAGLRAGLAGGRLAYRDEEICLDRPGLPERAFLNLDYSPVLGEDDQPAGVLAIVAETTGHVATQHRLQAERDRAAEVLESISDAFYAVDGDWRFTYVNSKAQEWWGRAATDLLGKHYWTAFPQAVGSKAYEEHLRAMADRVPVRLETVSPILQRWVGIDIHPTANGGLSVYFRDIGDQKRAEEAQRASDARLAAIFAGATVGLSEVNPDGRFLRVNEELCRLLGRGADALHGMTIADVTHPESLEPSLEAIADTLRTGKATSVDKRYVRPDGSVVWANSRVSRLDADARSSNLLVVTVDMSDRLAAEQRVRESEGRYRQIVEGAEDFAIASVDPDGRVTSWNTGAARITGFEEADILGRPGALLFTPEDRAAGAPDHELNRAASDGRSLNERWHMRKDGSRFWGSGLTMRLDQPGGGYLKIFRDRTAEHAAEAHLRRRSEQLQGLAETANAVTAAPTLEATLDEITRAARRIIGAHQAVVSLTQGEDWAQIIPYIDLSGKYAGWRTYATPADGSGIYALVCETNRPLRLTQAELEAHPRWRGFGAHAQDHPPMRGWLAVPLVGRDGRNLGLIQLSDKQDGSEFDEDDEAIIVQLARQAADIIERTQAQEALAAEVEALGRLQEVSTRLIRDESPQSVYDAILTAATELMGSECASIQMLNASGDLDLLAHRGYDPRSAAYWQTVGATSGSTCGIALGTGQRVIVPDVEDSGLAEESGDLKAYRWTGMRAVQTTPLLSRSGKPLGMLSTHWKRPHMPSERDLKLFDVLARQAADGIERVTAQAELRESQARQAFLLSLSDTLRALKSPLDIASAAAQHIGEQYGLSRVFYAEFFGSLMKVERDFTRGVASIVGEHELAAFGEPLLRAYHENPVVRIDDVRTDPRLGEDARGGLLAREVGAYLDVVLFEDAHWVSVLAMQSTTPRSWTPAEEALFREIGERVKAAIERATAEDQLRELNETLERRVAAALAERKLLADLVEGTDAFVQVVDADFRWLAVNRAAADEFERIYGTRPRVGASMLDLFADKPAHQAAAQALWARALGGEEFTAIGEFGDPSLDRRFYEMKFNVLRDASGARIGAYQFVYDVTQRIAEQHRLAEAEEALRQSQKMEAMGQLTGGVAHDFNNLLTPIVGSLDMLQRRGIGNEREQRLIAGAVQSAERARTLVQRLLAFARRQPLQPVAVDIARLVQGMGELVSSTTGPQIEVVLQAEDDLPFAKADPNQLEMALLNLAVNARDAMPGGGVLRIAAAAAKVGRAHRSGLKPGAYVKLSVADTGAGMDDATLARAIEPFFSTKGVGKGTGLGLSMVHGLASQLGGALTIQSQPGRGTTIELWLPQSEVAPKPEEQTGAQSLAPAARGVALLVDDEELVRMSTADMLTEMGYAVIEAASGEEAMQFVANDVAFDVLLTDHLMPGITGTDLARMVRTARPDVPVLLVSGYAETEGVDPNLPRLIKPFRKDELASSLAQLPAHACADASG